MVKQVKIEPGAQVRVARAEYHYAVFGAVGRVIQQYGTRPDDDCLVRVFINDGVLDDQYIENQHLKPIKKQS